MQILPEVEADFVFRFPEAGAGEPSTEDAGGVCFPGLQVFELSDALFGIRRIHAWGR